MEPVDVYRYMAEMRSDMRDDLNEIKAHLRTQNGRIGEAEKSIADSATQIAVLMDRSNSLRKTVAGWAAFTTAIMAACIELMVRWWHR